MTTKDAVYKVFCDCIDEEFLNDIVKSLEKLKFCKSKISEEILEETSDYLTCEPDMAWKFLAYFQEPEFCDYEEMIGSLKRSLKEIYDTYHN